MTPEEKDLMLFGLMAFMSDYIEGSNPDAEDALQDDLWVAFITEGLGVRYVDFMHELRDMRREYQTGRTLRYDKLQELRRRD